MRCDYILLCTGEIHKQMPYMIEFGCCHLYPGVDNIFTSGVDVEIFHTHGCIRLSMDVSNDRWKDQIINDWFNIYSDSNVQMRNTLVRLNNSTVRLLQS